AGGDDAAAVGEVRKGGIDRARGAHHVRFEHRLPRVSHRESAGQHHQRVKRRVFSRNDGMAFEKSAAIVAFESWDNCGTESARAAGDENRLHCETTMCARLRISFSTWRRSALSARSSRHVRAVYAY